jgi:hypothetical protein
LDELMVSPGHQMPAEMAVPADLALLGRGNGPEVA